MSFISIYEIALIFFRIKIVQLFCMVSVEFSNLSIDHEYILHPGAFTIMKRLNVGEILKPNSLIGLQDETAVICVFYCSSCRYDGEEDRQSRV